MIHGSVLLLQVVLISINAEFTVSKPLMSSPTSSAASSPSRRAAPHLVIHFDVNETCLIGDEAGGDTRDDCLNKILAKSAFVQKPSITDSNPYEKTSALEPTHWWDGTPIQEEYEADQTPPPLYTAWEWPEGCCPYYRTKFKRRSKDFVKHHGSIYKNIHDEMEERLTPHRCRGADEVLPPIYAEIPVLSHLIPAIFETLKVLFSSEDERSPTSSITIVFRTLGTDLPELAQAITAFALGRHPDYPDFYNEKLVMRQEDLMQGRWSMQDEMESCNNLNRREHQHVYQLWKNETQVASGDAEVVDFIHSHTICGIQDDYPFWKKNNHEPWAGKPVWILQRNYHHLLFDDNIHNLLHDSIASVRREDSDGAFYTLNGQEILDQQGLHLIRVPTIEPVLHPLWFLAQVKEAQEKFEATYLNGEPANT
jgi:hypothetical protein